MIWARIVDQIIIGPFKVDEGVQVNSANYSNFMDKTYFAWYKSQSCSFKMKYVFMHNNASKIYQREDNRMDTIKSWYESDPKFKVNC